MPLALRYVLVTLKYKGDTIFSTLTDTNGNYSFSNLYAGTTSTDYQVVPALVNYVFSPASPAYVDLTGGSNSQDFTATRVANLKGKFMAYRPTRPRLSSTLPAPKRRHRPCHSISMETISFTTYLPARPLTRLCRCLPLTISLPRHSPSA